jgi:Flp pilus assembly pilin Flp
MRPGFGAAQGSNSQPTGESKMLWHSVQRLVREQDGMEMVEWAIVGVVFAVAAAAFWGDLATNIDSALGKIETKVNP